MSGPDVLDADSDSVTDKFRGAEDKRYLCEGRHRLILSSTSASCSLLVQILLAGSKSQVELTFVVWVKFPSKSSPPTNRIGPISVELALRVNVPPRRGPGCEKFATSLQVMVISENE